jgi:hypothetical protein
VKSQIPTANSPTQIEILEGKIIDIAVNGFMTRLKCGRFVSAKNTLEEENTIKASRSL